MRGHGSRGPRWRARSHQRARRAGRCARAADRGGGLGGGRMGRERLARALSRRLSVSPPREGKVHSRRGNARARLRAAVDALLPGPDAPRETDELEPAVGMLERDYFLSRAAAAQIAGYLGEAKRSLGVVPTTDLIALERFFDESGGMQLVLHAP